jgi:hypothetical protein
MKSPLDSMVLEGKSSIDIDNGIFHCNDYENVIVEPFRNSKLICTRCGQIYDQLYGLVQVQDQETTIDELSKYL